MTTTEYGITSDFTLGQNYNTEGNANFSQLRRSASPEWGNKVSTTTALTYGYFGGTAWTGSAWSTVADGTTALTDNTTNYVERTLAGVVSVASTNFTASKIPMAIVVTVSGAITTFTDARREQVPSGAAFTTEDAQDAVGAMVDTTLVYTDATPLLSRAALTGDVTASAGSNTTALASSVNLPGNPTTTTQTAGNNTTRIATTAFVTTAVAGVTGALADGDYGDIVVSGTGTVLTIDSAVVSGAKIVSDVALGGNPTTTTQTAGNNTTRVATTAFVTTAVGAVTGAPYMNGFKDAVVDNINDSFAGASIDTTGARFTGATSWTALGSSTAVVDGKRLWLTVASQASLTVRGYHQPVPSGNWCVRMAIAARPGPNMDTGQKMTGLYLYDGTKLETLAVGCTGGASVLWAAKWTTATSFSASRSFPTLNGTVPPSFIEIEYDGTNYYMRCGTSDGMMHQLNSSFQFAKTNFLSTAATHIGVFGSNDSSVTTSFVSTGFYRVPVSTIL